MREEPSASWLRNGVATWNGAVYLFDSRRPRPSSRRTEMPPIAEDPVQTAEMSGSAPPEWPVSGFQSPMQEEAGWAIEFGTGRRVRTSRGRRIET